VVLEQLKREELRRQNKKSNEWSILSLLSPGLLLPTPS
jgi:hypothetical protein